MSLYDSLHSWRKRKERDVVDVGPRRPALAEIALAHRQQADAAELLRRSARVRRAAVLHAVEDDVVIRAGARLAAEIDVMHQAARGVVLPAVGQIVAAVDRPEVAARAPSSRGANCVPSSESGSRSCAVPSPASGRRRACRTAACCAPETCCCGRWRARRVRCRRILPRRRHHGCGILQLVMKPLCRTYFAPMRSAHSPSKWKGLLVVSTPGLATMWGASRRSRRRTCRSPRRCCR